jgi:hypothetical protein
MSFFNKSKLEYLLVLVWIGILFTINSISLDLINFQKKNANISLDFFFISINFIRFLLPFLILPILISVFFFGKKNKFNLLTIIFFLYIFWLIVVCFIKVNKENLNIQSILHHNTNNFLFNNIQLTFNSMSVLLIFYLGNKFNFKNFYRNILIITLIFIGIISLYFTYNLIIEKILFGLKYIYGTETLNPTKKIIYQASPRITGISRMLLIIFYLIFIITVLKEKNSLKLPVHAFFLIIINFLIYLMQSRGTFIGVLLIYILYFFFIPKKIKEKVLFFLITFLIPILIYEGIYHNTKIKNPSYEEIANKSPENRIFPEYQNNNLTFFTSSSGRRRLFEVSLKIIKEKKIILGYGTQADRLLLGQYSLDNEHLRQEKSIWRADDMVIIFDNNVSNALLYSYLSGGVIGTILMLLIYILISKEIYKIVFIKKIFYSSEVINAFSTVVLIYLSLRTFYENGFAVFGLDFILAVIAYNIIFMRNNSIKNY